MRDSLDFDALDDDEEAAGGNKPPAYDPSPNNNTNNYNNKKSNTEDANNNTKSTTLHDADDSDDDIPLPAPTPQRPAQIASVQRGAVQDKRSLDGDGEAMFSVGEDEEDADDVRGFSDSDEEGGGLVGKGRKAN